MSEPGHIPASQPLPDFHLPVLDVIAAAGIEALMGRTLAEMFRDHVWPAEALGTVAGQLSCEPCSAMAEAVVAHLRAEGWFVREYEGQPRFFPAESDPINGLKW